MRLRSCGHSVSSPSRGRRRRSESDVWRLRENAGRGKSLRLVTVDWHNDRIPVQTCPNNKGVDMASHSEVWLKGNATRKRSYTAQHSSIKCSIFDEKHAAGRGEKAQ